MIKEAIKKIVDKQDLSYEEAVWCNERDNGAGRPARFKILPF